MASGEENSLLNSNCQVDQSLIKQFNDAILEAKGVPNNEYLLLSQSQTIEIQLDEDPDYYMVTLDQAGVKLDAEILDFNEPPPLADEIRPRVAEGTFVGHLSHFALRQFEIFLDPPSLGTMYNWEYLAARLGLTTSEIMYLRTQKNPTSKVLFRFSSLPLTELLDIVCSLGRIDLLLALREYVSENSLAISTSKKPMDSGVADNVLSLASAGLIPVDKRNNVVHSPEDVPTKQKSILVVHHEEVDSIELKKNYTWLMKNLRKYAGENDVMIYDIDDCFDDTNLIETMNNMFTNAAHVIFVFSEDLIELLRSVSNCSLKKYVYNLSNGEYAQTLRNTRFRPLVFNKQDLLHLPVGWPTNTIVYEFPAMFSNLCTRIFK